MLIHVQVSVLRGRWLNRALLVMLLPEIRRGFSLLFLGDVFLIYGHVFRDEVTRQGLADVRQRLLFVGSLVLVAQTRLSLTVLHCNFVLFLTRQIGVFSASGIRLRKLNRNRGLVVAENMPLARRRQTGELLGRLFHVDVKHRVPWCVACRSLRSALT